MIFSPVIPVPFRDITAAIAHPEGILTLPSFCIIRYPLRKKKKAKAVIYAQGIPRTTMNAFAHLRVFYALAAVLSIVLLHFSPNIAAVQQQCSTAAHQRSKSFFEKSY
jgi:hypothetical protein